MNSELKSIVGGGTWTLREHNSVNGSQYSGVTHETNVVFETLGSDAIRQMNIYHEFGHVLDNSPGLVDAFSGALGNLDSPSFIGDDNHLDTAALINTRVDDPNYGTAQAIQHDSTDPIEQWADIFANYVAANIDVSSPQGRDMNNFVNNMLGIDVIETR